MSDIVKVAVTQHEPIWFDLQATVDKTCRLIEEAASNGAKLIAFPEVWVSGARPLDPPLATKYIKNSLSYDSPEMDRICASARRACIAVSLGFSENDHNSLYIAQCTIAPSGAIVMKRRKFKPTHMERTVYGDAGGSSLNNVPLLKYHTISLREEVHVAAWPPVHAHVEE
ncbi:hypothetical protein N0V86_005526 [Didymella sp. IMI 355093]|nr:hypothetical protein N0V86_005526 [Didymella sp. IMI 355093]